MYQQNDHTFPLKKTLYNINPLQNRQWTLDLGPRE